MLSIFYQIGPILFTKNNGLNLISRSHQINVTTMTTIEKKSFQWRYKQVAVTYETYLLNWAHWILPHDEKIADLFHTFLYLFITEERYKF
jgi:hypothetical protein